MSNDLQTEVDDTVTAVKKWATPGNIARATVGFVVGSGTGKIAREIIVHNTHAPETKLDKVTMSAAAVVIGMMAKDATKNYTDTKIRKWQESWRKAGEKSKVKAADTE